MFIKRVEIKDLTFSGMGEGISEDGKKVRVWGAYPTEIVDVHIYKEGDVYEGVVDKIIKKAPYRIEPEEDHYLISSPWQTIEWTKENEFKTYIFRKIFQEITGKECEDVDIYYSSQQFGYRNTMEFNIAEDEEGLRLALLARGRKRLVLVDGNKLAYSNINEATRNFVDFLSGYDVKGSSLDIVKVVSNRLGEIQIGLFVKDIDFLNSYNIDFFSFLKNRDYKIRGISIYHKTKEDNKLLASFGQDFISEVICGQIFRFSIIDFFQANIPIFEEAVNVVKSYVEGKDILDFYGGVGIFSVCLSDSIKSALLVEANPVSVRRAHMNIEANHLDKDKYRLISGKAEENTKYITNNRVLIVNPPREGLGKRVIQRIISAQPERIIYLSCKPYTQIRDIYGLLNIYAIEHISLYNFFPRTPHIESLLVLNRK